MTETYRGGCHCGAVRYEIVAAPLMAADCQCRSCQQLSGAGHASHIGFPKAAATITGELKGYDWTADSGNTVTTSFCPSCGSPIAGLSSGYPDMITIRAASLDDPTAYQPQIVVFTKSAQPWDHVGDVPRFETMPPMAPA